MEMIEGITKAAGAEALTVEERQAGAAAYIAGMDALFAKFDPQTGGNDILSVDAPFDDDEEGIAVIAERNSKLLQVFAPDGQIHTYGPEETDTAVRRDDGISIASMGRPDDRVNTTELSVTEELARLKRIIADREALAAYEAASRLVDEEEVQALFTVLLQGRINREVQDLDLE